MDRVLGGVEIGATRLRALVVRTDGTISARADTKTRRDEGFQAVMEQIGGTLKEACTKAGVELKDLDAVGVGAPGPIRPNGNLANAPELGWTDVPVVSTLSDILGIPVAAENDCNVATLGEYEFGGGRDIDSLVGMFVYDGLGCGIVVNGGLVRGKNHLAAEVGHMIVNIDGRRCTCGHRGCLGAYASKTAIRNRFIEEIEVEGRISSLQETGIDLRDVPSAVMARAYAEGDDVVCEVLLEMARYVGLGAANLITLLGPEVIVIGGDLFQALESELMGPVRESAKATTFPQSSFEDVSIVLSELGDDAVALGAAAFARRAHLG